MIAIYPAVVAIILTKESNVKVNSGKSAICMKRGSFKPKMLIEVVAEAEFPAKIS